MFQKESSGIYTSGDEVKVAVQSLLPSSSCASPVFPYEFFKIFFDCYFDPEPLKKTPENQNRNRPGTKE